MKFITTNLTLICFLLSTGFAHATGTVGNGGDPYLDELNEYRQLTIQALKYKRHFFLDTIDLTEQEFDSMLEKFSQVNFYRSDLLDQIQDFDGKKYHYREIFNRDLADLFWINGEMKSAINYSNERLSVVIFNIPAWDALDGKVVKKLQLVAHELFGIMDLEVTGQNHLSKHFNERVLSELMSLDEKLPVIPIWSDDYIATFNMGTETGASCHSPASMHEFKKAIGEICRRHLPNDPHNFFAYECVFSGNILQKIDKDWKITKISTTAYIPRTRIVVKKNSIYKYYYQSHSEIEKIFRAENSHKTLSRPAYYLKKLKLIKQPVYQTSCILMGRNMLSGIDPMTEDMSTKLLKSSEGRWDEIAVTSSPDPVHYFMDICYENRLKIRKKFFNQSYCTVDQKENGQWRWQLWGVHPYRNPIKFEN